VKDGLGAGAVALLVGLQPVLTAIWQSARVSNTASTVGSGSGCCSGSPA